MLNTFTSSLYVVLAIVLVACGDSKLVLKDAQEFCAAYSELNFRTGDASESLSAAEVKIHEKHLALMNTSEFKRIVNDLSEVRFLRDMYPTAKAMIQEVTGTPWDCPDMEQFYSLRVEKSESESNPQVEALVLHIAKSGNILYQGVIVDLAASNALPDGIKEAIANRHQTKVEIRMAADAEDVHLEPVFQFLAENGVGDVRVFSED